MPFSHGAFLHLRMTAKEGMIWGMIVHADTIGSSLLFCQLQRAFSHVFKRSVEAVKSFEFVLKVGDSLINVLLGFASNCFASSFLFFFLLPLSLLHQL
jgi:hypothetical protein